MRNLRGSVSRGYWRDYGPPCFWVHWMVRRSADFPKPDPHDHHRDDCRDVALPHWRALQPIKPIVLHWHCVLAFRMLFHAVVRETIRHSGTERRDAFGVVVIQFGDITVWHRAIDGRPHRCARHRWHGRRRVSTLVSRPWLSVSFPLLGL